MLTSYQRIKNGSVRLLVRGLVLLGALGASTMALCSQADEPDDEEVIVQPPEWPISIFDLDQPPVIVPVPLVSPAPAIASRSTSELASRSRRFDPSLRTPGRRASPRLATVPHMFGDFVGLDPQLSENGLLVADMPLVAGSRVKLAENNSAAVMDRAYVTYQHFHNALQFDADPTVVSRPANGSVDRVVVGLEKTLLDGLCSIDFRLPVFSSFGFPGAPFGVFDGGTLGNLTVTPKFMLLASDTSVLSAGMGINSPTGDDTRLEFDGYRFTVRNQAVHLLPFVGFLTAPGDVAFLQAFAQLDLATNGNAVEITDPIYGNVSPAGIFTEQNLLHVDVMGGHWLWRDSTRSLTGLAVLLELHYTSTVQDTDIVAAPTIAGPVVALLNTGNRQDVFNFTAGMQVQVGDNTAIRAGAVFPLRDENNRFFDSELNLQVNRRF